MLMLGKVIDLSSVLHTIDHGHVFLEKYSVVRRDKQNYLEIT